MFIIIRGKGTKTEGEEEETGTDGLWKEELEKAFGRKKDGHYYLY